MYKCTKCKQEKNTNRFQLYKGKPNGWCRECKTKHEKERRRNKGAKEKRYSIVIDGMKSCMTCNTMKPLQDFSPSTRGKGGVASYCKECLNRKNRTEENRSKARKTTAKYRKDNRERYLAMHRLHQFNRKALTKAVSDGTLTDSVLKEIYATEKCYYCHNVIPRELRTLEHKIPLSKGGIHGILNVTMACFSCNSSKRHLTEKEFNDNRSKDNS